MQNNMAADYRLPMYQVPRKPVATTHAGLNFHQPADAASPNRQLNPSFENSTPVTHQRSRTSSSAALPYMGGSYPQHHSPSYNYHLQHPGQRAGPSAPSANHAAHHQQPPSRRLSNATTSTSSTGGHYQTYTMSTSSSDIHRSSSSRSANVRLGYVALMRRQKGTVWCDRAQPEDPRLLAQKRAAKQRAYMELNGAGRTGTLGCGKIRHNGKSATDFSPATLVGATVPVRLSANEVGDDDEDERSSDGFHRRTGSGRSSMGSIHRYPSGYQRPQGRTPPNEQADIPEVAETAPPEEKENQNQNHEGGESKADDTTVDKEAEEENSFGDVGDMSAPTAANAAMEKAKKAEELRRRGSVDDRTTSMTTGVRLFVANPDVD